MPFWAPNPYQRLTYEDVVTEQRPLGDALDLAFAEACERLTPDGFSLPTTRRPSRASAHKPDGQTAARFGWSLRALKPPTVTGVLDVGEHRQRFKSDSDIRQQRGLPAMAGRGVHSGFGTRSARMCRRCHGL